MQANQPTQMQLTVNAEPGSEAVMLELGDVDHCICTQYMSCTTCWLEADALQAQLH